MMFVNILVAVFLLVDMVGCGSVGMCRWGMGRRLGSVYRGVGWCYVCVSCEFRFSV